MRLRFNNWVVFLGWAAMVSVCLAVWWFFVKVIL